MSYSLIIDVLVAVLLAVTIGYAIILNKRLGKLRADKKELEKLATKFGHSTHRAEESIDKLKHTADLLQDSMDKAQALRDDLAFLIDRGDRAAEPISCACIGAARRWSAPSAIGNLAARFYIYFMI